MTKTQGSQINKQINKQFQKVNTTRDCDIRFLYLKSHPEKKKSHPALL